MPSNTFSTPDPTATNEYDVLVQSDSGFGELFYDHVLKTPNAEAVIEGDQTLSYVQLHSQALQLANRLQEGQIFLPGEPVGILVEHGINDVVAQVATIYAGGSCVPLDPSLPQHQLESRLIDVGSQLLIVDAENQNRLPSLRQVVINSNSFSLGESTGINSMPVSTTLDHRTHLLYTSGTTGNPKTVQILARAVLQVACYLPKPPIGASDRLAHVMNSTFDISMFEIWAPLLRGATIVALNRNFLLDPSHLAACIDRYRITHMCLTPAVLNLAVMACPAAFARLKMLTSGGEALKKDTSKKILESGAPGQLINCYGPTECTIMSLTHRVTLDDVEESQISIGKPLGRTLAYVLDESFQPVPEEQVGELFIGGPGVSPGYLNLSEKNSSSFLNIAGLSQSNGDSVRFYRTGDLVKRRKSGVLDYCGRRDNQVKIRGFRVELEAVEAVLLRTGCFSDVVALKIDSPQEGAGAQLVAYGVPILPHPDFKNDVMKTLSSFLPGYMVPRIELVDELPINRHGKFDRKRLAELELENWQARQRSAGGEDSNDTISLLKRSWLNILPVAPADVDSNSDFFVLGGTSLQAAVLIHQIRQSFGTEISSLALYDNSTLAGLAELIDASKKGKVELKDEREIWSADAKLTDCFQAPPPGRLRDWRADTEGRVFLTGVTGFVGVHFLSQLLRMHEVLQAGCLKYQLWDDSFAGKLLVFPGNLVNADLGLGLERFEAIAEWASVVFHMGAHVNYTQPYSVHRPANVVGTLNVLRLVATGRRKALHYVSSISAFGPTGLINRVTHVLENEPLEPHRDALLYDHGYSQSQWVAEQMLWNVIQRGFPVAIYRPGFVTGSSTTGLSNPDDFLSRLVTACLHIGSYPILPHQRKELVTVDWVNEAILHISSSEKNLGQAYHLVPPLLSDSVDIQETFRLISINRFSEIQGLPYAQWLEQLKQDTHPRLLPLLPMLQEVIYRGMTRWELYERMPVYETINTRRALADRQEDLDCVKFDARLAALYLKQWGQPSKEINNAVTNGSAVDMNGSTVNGTAVGTNGPATVTYGPETNGTDAR